MTDERPDEPEDPNQRLFDETIRRGVDLMRVETFLLAEVLASWRGHSGRIASAIETTLSRVKSRGDGVLRSKAVRKLAQRQGRMIDRAFADIRKAFRINLDDLASREMRWTIETLGEALPNFDFGKLRPKTIERVWKTRPMVGKAIPEWYRELSRNAKRDLLTAIRTGITEGDSLPGIMRRVRTGRGAALRVTERHLETFVRSSVSHVSNSVNRATVSGVSKQAGITRERFYATLDKTTCQVCASYDGRVWPIGKGPYPLIHPRCNCKRLPVIPGAPQSTRATADGSVPASTHMHDYLRRQPVAVQEQVLGKTRAKLFREGKLGDLEPRYLVDANNRPLPLRDLLTKLEREGKS